MVALDIPEGDFGGYIFDCDGTLADTMPIHYRAWCEAMEALGGQFPEELFYGWGGKPALYIVEELNDRFGLSLDPVSTVHLKEAAFLRNLPGVKPVGPVLDFARSVATQAPLAVASGGHHELVDATLAALGITDLFAAVVCAEDYARGKPAPDPFLEAARQIGVPPADCLVFEDSPTGIESAKAAGMQWVLVKTAPDFSKP